MTTFANNTGDIDIVQVTLSYDTYCDTYYVTTTCTLFTIYLPVDFHQSDCIWERDSQILVSLVDEMWQHKTSETHGKVIIQHSTVTFIIHLCGLQTVYN